MSCGNVVDNPAMPDKVLACIICNKTFGDRHDKNYLLKEHMLKHSGELKCDLCHSTFSTRQNLKRHKRTKHSTENDSCIMCEHCGLNFLRSDSYKEHVAKVHGQTFECSTCNKKFLYKKNLIRHQRAHRANQHLYICGCGSFFSRKHNLDRHSAKCNGHKPKSKPVCKPKPKPKQDSIPKTRGSVKDQLICNVCDASFTRMDNLKRHSVMHSGRHTAFTCDECGKSWSRQYRLDRHICQNALKASSSNPENVKARVSKHRLIKSLSIPSSPTLKSNLVESMIKSPSKRTRQILEKKGYIQSEGAQQTQIMCKAILSDAQEVLSSVKSKRGSGVISFKQKVTATFIGDETKKCRKVSKVAKALFVPKTARRIQKTQLRTRLISGEEAAFTDVSRKSRGEKIPETWKQKICEFWSEDVSHATTDTKRNRVRRRISKNEYLEHSRHILVKSYREAYMEFHAKNPEVRVSEVTFRRLKPFFVKPATARDLEQCCCQKCVSVRKALRGLMAYRRRQNLDVPAYKDVYSLVKATLCPKQDGKDFHELTCLKQECDQCGLQCLKFHEQELTTSDLVTWFKFEYVEFKTKDERVVKHLDLVRKSTTPKVIIDYLLEVLIGFPFHLFCAKWQREQWKSLIQNLPANQCAIELDFSENYSILTQEEAQSCHWSKTQCTIHSCVVWRPSVPSDATDREHVKEHWLIISDDLCHDHQFVRHNMEEVILPELKNMGCMISVLHQRTDGCAAQYKSKHSFGDLSRSDLDLGVKRIINFSASGHGKGEVDQAAGFLKTEAKRAVIVDVDTVIANAKDLYDFAQTCLVHRKINEGATLHKRRFFYVPKTAVTRTNTDKYNTIPNTRKLHSLASVGQDGCVLVREMSCYCIPCINEEYKSCENNEYVDCFKDVTFSKISDDTPSEDGFIEDEIAELDKGDHVREDIRQLSSMICRDSVVAIMPSVQSLDDYYLLHITSDGMITLDEDTQSEYGIWFPKGSEVLMGQFYQHHRSTRDKCMYKKEKKQAIVHKNSVLYVGVELYENEKDPRHFDLLRTDHEDILCTVSLRM